MMKLTETIKHLLIINGILFVFTLIMGDQMNQIFALWYPENPNFRYWQVLSYMFMHGGFMHLFFNMYALWAFGSPLEFMWGRKKFLFFYISCGVGSAIIHTGVNAYMFQHGLQSLVDAGFSAENTLEILREGKHSTLWYDYVRKSEINNFERSFFVPAVGASGAIYGLLVAFAMTFPNTGLYMFFIPIPIKAKYFISVLIGLDLFSGVTGYSLFGEGIAHFAHIGGAVFGFIMVWYWRRRASGRL